MPSIRTSYGRVAYGGRTQPRARPDGGLLVPTFDAIYYLSSSTRGVQRYGRSYGGRNAITYPVAGIVALPDSPGGLITVPLWWARADFVTVRRLHPDGSIVQVRDAEAFPMPKSRSRRNRASNPKAKASTTGYSAGTGTTLTRLTGQADTGMSLVTTGLRATITSGDTATIRVNIDPLGPIPEPQGFLVRTSSVAATLGLAVDWYDRDSVYLSTTTYPVTSAARTAAASGWTWATVTINSFPARAATGAGAYVATGMAVGDTLDVTARLRETTLGSYFDGDFEFAGWIGTPGLSYSDLGVLVYITDAEAPLDVPVRYQVSSSAAPGYVATSDEVTLDGSSVRYSRRQCLMTHPGLAHTIAVWVEMAPDSISKAMEQGVFEIEGRRFPVVVTGEQRSSARGSMTFVAETFDERARLETFLDDGSPLLLRFPASFGYPPNWWLSFGDLDIKHWTHDATKQLRRLTLPFIETDRPSVATRPLAA